MLPKPMQPSIPLKKQSKLGNVKITLTIPGLLLEDVDTTAKRDYASRSDVIRQALVDYIRQYRQATGGLEPEVALKILRRRVSMANLNKMLKEIDLDEDLTQVS